MLSKRVVKEEHDDDSDENVPIAKKLPKKEPKQEVDEDDEDNLPIALSKPKKLTKKEPKQESEDDDDEDHLPISRTKSKKQPTPNKQSVKKKMVTVKKVEKGRKENGVTSRVRKVYDLPGQKHDPPEERDPLRIFYESLYQQMPTSDMAAAWMMEWGLLPPDEAEMVFEKKKNLPNKLKSPITATVERTVKTSVKQIKKETPVKTNLVVAKKRKARDDSSDESDDDDFVTLKKKVNKKKKIAS